mmetsp:Transcript_148784/g.477868  ORF Transcript_148784/g.477868 Transcript_148784/m.477868 type:complete len:239 (+) Transcript_148784:620-1336(+)
MGGKSKQPRSMASNTAQTSPSSSLPPRATSGTEEGLCDEARSSRRSTRPACCSKGAQSCLLHWTTSITRSRSTAPGRMAPSPWQVSSGAGIKCNASAVTVTMQAAHSLRIAQLGSPSTAPAAAPPGSATRDQEHAGDRKHAAPTAADVGAGAVLLLLPPLLGPSACALLLALAACASGGVSLAEGAAGAAAGAAIVGPAPAAMVAVAGPPREADHDTRRWRIWRNYPRPCTPSPIPNL